MFLFFSYLKPIKIETNKVYHSFTLSRYPSEVKEIVGAVPKVSIAERFLENQFCMFQPFKGKQNLGVFKVFFKTGNLPTLAINANLGRKY